MLYPRGATDRIRIALKDTPVVLINGPRQCGKTTLARTLLQSDRPYFTFDDETTLLSARTDPVGFIRQIDTAILDEVQRVPEILRAIKLAVDDDRRPGRFLLTGSANILALPTVSDSLAGRMEVVTLLPLAQAEIRNGTTNFLDTAFAGQATTPSQPLTGDALIELCLFGGYPEMLSRSDPKRRSAWARDYIRAIVERDVRDIADVERLDQMPQLMRGLAHHSGQLLNFTQLAGQVGLDDKTARRYIGLFEQLFLVRRIEPWFRNPLNRLVKTPKLLFLDSGLLAALIGITADRVRGERSLFGPILETFAVNEIFRLSTWSAVQTNIHHYRDKDQDEVDVILEDEMGSIAGFEIKASATVTPADFKGLRKVAAATGVAFRAGWVLYDGDKVLPFGDRLAAVPLSCLWSA
ncbi:putative ATPase (AAA+ superfamily) [Rhizobium leguminosarum bv. trifolii WSM2297]|uniref:Putative ATPase (AAA+ superfamily) n=1 Tax=Rhizobium leguminosarum bv. trifolii WSM2297 TaxID=754762 RepID=J0WJW4_RHILT|nr:ATP-binding protein [Rhizobium leguminosarum]EJC85343.1 putative ATPase (AAA+ superfamily) [Rhizobium leguminosarum bv. trifolii WSM2297]EJC85773.1 putative ATPase (AAA+ superfamily) [Rhizobium leguminosarum bv. trifolii WSM2297]